MVACLADGDEEIGLDEHTLEVRAPFLKLVVVHQAMVRVVAAVRAKRAFD